MSGYRKGLPAVAAVYRVLTGILPAVDMAMGFRGLGCAYRLLPPFTVCLPGFYRPSGRLNVQASSGGEIERGRERER
eukprot:1600202-Alexandrium_andersonii.AAC.1